MTVRPLDVGLIGYGFAGAFFHAPFIAATPGLRLSAIVTGNAERQQRARQDHPDTVICSAIDDLWSRRSSLDVVVVASPIRTHVALARTVIEAGLPVVVDKPLAATSAEARALVAFAREKGVPLTVYQNRRWDGDFQTLRALVADGAIGRPVRFESRFERWRPTPKPGWRESAAPEDAGGLLFDLGAHLIDQARVLCGPPTHVYAEVDVRRPDAEVDDDTFVALTHRSGVRSHLFMSVLAADRAPRFSLRGTEAAYVKFEMDPQENALLAGLGPGRPDWGQDPESRWGRIEVAGESRPVRTTPGAYQQFYVALERALRGSGPLPVDAADSVAVLEIIEAARRASGQRTVVELPA